MVMPGRSFSSTNQYRYGFNGKENGKDISEGGQDYGMRIYDGRLGKFLSVDPLTKSYPSMSPYPYAMNRPIDGIDLDGLEWIHYKIQFKENSNGKPEILSKITVEDFRNKSESQLNVIHGTKSFYSEYSQGFGEKGRGVLYTYEELDEKGNVKSSKQEMEVKSKLTRHGFYAGQGCITKSGELITPGEYGNYDFGMKPIDMGDAIAKEHDFLQNKPNHKGFMHTDYLNSDVLFLIKLKKFESDFKNNPNYIDPFTGRKVSKESKKFTSKSIALFEFFVATKVAILNSQLEKKEISQDQYDHSMFLYRNMRLVENGPMPNPSDKLNKDSK